MKTAIVTDSTSDIPTNLLKELGIFHIPVDLTLGNQTYLDGFDLSRTEFYNQLPDMEQLPTTAAPSAGRFQKLYSTILEAGYQEIISLHPSKKLSGIFNAARLAAEDFSQPIQVIDSQQLSMGLGFQVLKAAELALNGESAKRILQEVRSVLERVRVFALLDTFKYIQRSGRVSWAKARIGSILDIKPVLELKAGEVINKGVSRTRGRGIKLLAEKLKNLNDLESLAILHTNAHDEGQQFIQQYAPITSTEPLLVNVTTIIGTHIGPKGLGFAAVVK